MIYIENPLITDPYVNMAVEEYLLRHVVNNEPSLLFYVNAPSVIVGRNQNVFEEIDLRYVREQGIPVLRRLSGGGTVYHDPGNINFSLITPDQNLLNNYAAFTRPVLDALKALGLTAELRNRSSIFVNDEKVSGNAQYASAGRLVSHGTLLLNSDLDQLRRVIRPRHLEVESRAVHSVRSHVANLCDLLDRDTSLNIVKNLIRRAFLGAKTAKRYYFSDNDWEVVQEIAEERYRSWAWNIGRSPKFSTRRRVQTQYGDVVLDILVDKGAIQAVNLIENNPQLDLALTGFSDCLQGTRYDLDEITLALHYCSEDLPPGLSEEQLLALIY